ncbi:hypothetical protein F5Y14DRAFT_397208 [Nemania sp. NC0429]|nr:hypothetical protein F5Y14DRAFT_397208 [Nemania sp. NC0429]
MSSNYITERPAGREHIPLYPKGFIAVRYIQLVLGIICLGLTAYAVAVLPLVGAVLMLFTSIITLISSIYILVGHYGPPRAYNYWAILGFDIFHVIFWLVSFALLASQAAVVFAYSDYYYGYYSYQFVTFGSIVAAAAGLGGGQWVVSLVALVLHSIAFHRHRKAGLHAMPGTAASIPATGAPVEAEKIVVPPQQPETYYAPQQGHDAAYQQQAYQPPQQQQVYQQLPYQPQTYQQQTPQQ